MQRDSGCGGGCGGAGGGDERCAHTLGEGIGAGEDDNFLLRADGDGDDAAVGSKSPPAELLVVFVIRQYFRSSIGEDRLSALPDPAQFLLLRRRAVFIGM